MFSPQAKQAPYTTTIYGKAPSSKYLLKMKASRNTFSEITQKAGAFPFTLRMLENETQARLGVTECVQHGEPYTSCREIYPLLKAIWDTGLLKQYEPQ